MKDSTINEQSFIDIDAEDNNHAKNHYYAKSVYNILHLTRETVRYYEKLGLIQPDVLKENSYRSFSVHDIEKMMWIDLYKKRGFTAKEIHQLTKLDTIEDYHTQYEKKKVQLQNEIEQLQKKIQSLDKDMKFLKDINEELPDFTIREMPLFEVIDKVPSVASIMLSEGNVLPQINWEEENYVSNLIRCVRFDGHGYIDSEICYIKEANEIEPGKTYLQQGKCLYTPVVSELQDTNTMGDMFLACNAWLREHAIMPKGVVYIRPRIWIEGTTPRLYVDCWVPIV